MDDFHIVDCRYPYEYKGGHIRGAQNIWEKDAFLKQFFAEPQYMPESKRRIIIFHCEFSSKRGPEMYVSTLYIHVCTSLSSLWFIHSRCMYLAVVMYSDLMDAGSSAHQVPIYEED